MKIFSRFNKKSNKKDIKTSESNDLNKDNLLTLEIENLDIEKKDEAIIEESRYVLEETEINNNITSKIFDKSQYSLPSIELLELPNNDLIESHEEISKVANNIISTFRSYGVKVEKVKISTGANITLFEFSPQEGTRISKIIALKNDLAFSLGKSVLSINPIIERGTIGITIPNEGFKALPLASILASEKFINDASKLPIVIGNTLLNEEFIIDLTETSHLLIAGSTGQGKSVLLNTIITSLLFKKYPNELKFILIDPQIIEFNLYSPLEKHYLTKLPDEKNAIITNSNLINKTLNSLCIEMDQRFELFSNAMVRNVEEYNIKLYKKELNNDCCHLPYIVVIIDEIANLDAQDRKKTDFLLEHLTRKAHNVGIYFIISTQRPTVNVISGNVKSNFSARISFNVASSLDSRLILDENGAEDLFGKGDLLFLHGTKTTRIQAPYISSQEIKSIVSFISSQNECVYLLPQYLDENSEPLKEFDSNERDEKFDEAARIVVAHQHGSTSLIQRKLLLGYNRAGRIIDQLESAGIIGPFEGSMPREVKIKSELELDEFFKTLK